MADSADPDQLASSGSTVFAKAGYIWFQHDKGLDMRRWANEPSYLSCILRQISLKLKL